MVAQVSVDNVKIKAKEQAKDIGKRAARALNKEKVSHAKKVKKLKSHNDTQKQNHLLEIENIKREHENQKKVQQVAHAKSI